MRRNIAARSVSFHVIRECDSSRRNSDPSTLGRPAIEVTLGSNVTFTIEARETGCARSKPRYVRIPIEARLGDDLQTQMQNDLTASSQFAEKELV